MSYINNRLKQTLNLKQCIIILYNDCNFKVIVLYFLVDHIWYIFSDFLSVKTQGILLLLSAVQHFYHMQIFSLQYDLAITSGEVHYSQNSSLSQYTIFFFKYSSIRNVFFFFNIYKKLQHFWSYCSSLSLYENISALVIICEYFFL